jgi:hypothetical protein
VELSTFKKELDALLRSVDSSENNESLELKNSKGCVRCHFCADCTACFACTYANHCELCTHCNRIDDCTRCHRSSHLKDCSDCNDSHYLIECNRCVECTYCIGCVGLTRKEFHILNQPYDRKTFFKIAKALGLKHS